jgi:hypothetical protein
VETVIYSSNHVKADEKTYKGIDEEATGAGPEPGSSSSAVISSYSSSAGSFFRLTAFWAMPHGSSASLGFLL